MLFIVDHEGREAPLKQMANAVVAGVEALRVDPREPVHSLREPRQPRLDDQVNVVAHQAVGVQAPAEAANRLVEELHERRTVDVVPEDQPSLDAAAGDVVDASLWQDVARATWHRRHRSAPDRLAGLVFEYWHERGANA